MKIGYLKQPGIITIGQPNPNLIVGETLDLNLYDDITSIENWYGFGLDISTDWLQVRSRVIEVINQKGGWSQLTNQEKDICIELYARQTGVTTQQDSQNKVIHLIITKGMSQAQAVDRLQQAYADFHVKEIDACSQRANSEKVFKIVAKYLNINDAADFIKISSNLYLLYKTQGIRGINDGEAGVGLFDFIESTNGTDYEYFGLAQRGYTTLTGTIQNFITELMDVLRNGNY